MVRTGEFFPVAGEDPFDEGRFEDADGQTDGAFDDHDIIGGGVDEDFFGFAVDPGFFSADEIGADLNTVVSDGDHFFNIGSACHFTGTDDGDVGAIELFEDFFHIMEQDIEGACFGMFDLFQCETEMSAVPGTFHDNGIGLAVILFLPCFEDDFQCSAAGHNGDERDIGIAHIFRQLQRQSGTGDDEIHTGSDAGLHDVLIVGEGDHHIDAEGFFIAAEFFGFGDFICKGFPADLIELLFRFFGIAHTNAGDGAETALIDGFSSKGGGADPDTHTSLNDGVLAGQISDLQRRKFHLMRGAFWI